MREVLLTAAAVWLAARNSEAAAQNKSRAAPVKLTAAEFPDGTGTIGLPTGWRLDGAYRGTCGCKGPGGSGIIMGMGSPILRADHPIAGMSATPTTIPRAMVGDLRGAIRSILEVGNNRVISLRSRPAPPTERGVPAAYFLYEYARAGKRITALGYFTTLQFADSSPYWQLYSSYVNAPSERFMQDLPTMMVIWNSWRPNGKKPKAGTESAMLDSVLKQNQIKIGESMRAQRESFERMQAKFKETL